MTTESAFVEKYNEWMLNHKLNSAQALGKKDDIDENNNIKGDNEYNLFLVANSKEHRQLYDENNNLNYIFGKKLNNQNCNNLIKYFRSKHDNIDEYIDKQYEELLKSEKSFDIFKEIISLHPEALKIIILNEQDLYYVYKYALAINGLTLEFINQKTEELCLIAVKNNGYALRFIDCQTDEICIAAIKSVAENKCEDPGRDENGLSDNELYHRTEDQLAGLQVKPLSATINNFNKYGITTSNYYANGQIKSPLKYVRYQNENICKFAVQYCDYALKVVKNKTPLICMVSVRNNGLSLEYVDNQTNEICENAVQQNGLALEYVKIKTEKIYRIAVKKSPHAIRYVDQNSSYFEELCKIAITRDIHILQYYTSLPEHLYRYAVHIDGRSLQYISNQTRELVYTAIETTPSIRDKEYIKI